jgi:hypothetical protein
VIERCLRPPLSILWLWSILEDDSCFRNASSIQSFVQGTVQHPKTRVFLMAFTAPGPIRSIMCLLTTCPVITSSQNRTFFGPRECTLPLRIHRLLRDHLFAQTQLHDVWAAIIAAISMLALSKVGHLDHLAMYTCIHCITFCPSVAFACYDVSAGIVNRISGKCSLAQITIRSFSELSTRISISIASGLQSIAAMFS